MTQPDSSPPNHHAHAAIGIDEQGIRDKRHFFTFARRPFHESAGTKRRKIRDETWNVWVQVLQNDAFVRTNFRNLLI